jgi:putative tail protein
MANVIKGPIAKQPTTLGALQVQTSQSGGVVPLVYGTTRVAGNLLQYDGFGGVKIEPPPGGKGGITGKSGVSSGFTYLASIIIGYCRGPIQGIGTLWEDRSIVSYSLANFNGQAQAMFGSDGQPADPFWSSHYGAAARNYSGTAYASWPQAVLGTNALTPSNHAEIIGFFAGTGQPNGNDANPAHIITDFLTNPRYGCGFPAENLADLSDYQNYCNAVGIGLSPQIDQQQEAQQCLSDIARATNSAIVWSGNLLKIIPYGDQPVSSPQQFVVNLTGGTLHGGDTFTITFTDPTIPSSPFTVSATSTSQEPLQDFGQQLAEAIAVQLPPEWNITVQAVYQAQVEAPNLASNPNFDASLYITAIINIVMIQNPATGQTSLSVTGPAMDATIEVVNEGPAPAPSTWTPDTAPIYSLDDSDFIANQSTVGDTLGLQAGSAALRSGAGPATENITSDPIVITRSSPADAINWIDVEFRDRLNWYNAEVAPAWDQASIDQYGIRKGSPLKAYGVCEFIVAAKLAQIAVQRSIGYRNKYQFRLGWKYILLEPMDLIEITDSRLGLINKPVRIISIEEDAEGTLNVIAEDWLIGQATAIVYPKQWSTSYATNFSGAPDPVSAVVLFEATPAMSVGTQLMAAVAGGAKFGSAQVHMSLDGDSYGQMGTIGSAGTLGVLSADLPDADPVDTVNVLSVDLSPSFGSVNSVSPTTAASLSSLCWVADDVGGPGEFLAYQTAELTGDYAYDLKTLYRGAYGSPITAHSAGAAFVVLGAQQGALGRFAYDPALIGQTVYLKFPALNVVGGGGQSLADVPAFSCTLNGGVAVAFPVVIEFYFGSSTPGASAIPNPWPSPFAVSFNPDFGSIAGGAPQARASVAAAADTVFTVQQALLATPNVWVDIGTVTFAHGDVNGVFATTSHAAQSLAPGDTIQIVAPASPDATLAGVSINLVGSR